LQYLPVDKMPVGKGEKMNGFRLHTVNYNGGDILYLFTNGFADQFGGPKGKKFKYKQLEDILLTNSTLSLSQQSSILNQRFTDWKGKLEQVDDVLIIGLRV